MMGSRRGVTLIEMVIVAGLIALMAGVAFPTVSSGLDRLRLASAGNSLVAFLNSALTRAERRQEVIEVTISPGENTVQAISAAPGFERELELPDGVTIVRVLPPLPVETEEPRRFLLYPGGAVPRIGVEIANRRGMRRIVRVDPITGVPQIEPAGTP